MKNLLRYKFSRTLNAPLMVAALVSLIAAEVYAGCPSISVEAITGSGSDEKIGFSSCETGCDKRVFATSTAGASSKCIFEYWTTVTLTCGTFVDYSRYEEETITGSSFSYAIRYDSDNCSATSPITGTANSITRINLNTKSSSSACSNGQYDYSCESVVVSGSTITAQSCGGGCLADPGAAGYSLVSSNFNSDPCVGDSTTLVWEKQDGNTKYKATSISYSTSGYKGEYTTQTMLDRADSCAEKSLAQKDLAAGDGVGGVAECAFSLASDQTSVSIGIAKWRTLISGTVAAGVYELELTWLETINGVVNSYTETRSLPGSDLAEWYYPGPGGEPLLPKRLGCNSTYSKKLVGTRIIIVK